MGSTKPAKTQSPAALPATIFNVRAVSAWCPAHACYSAVRSPMYEAALLGSGVWQREIEGRSAPRTAFRPHTASISLDNSLADRQAQTRARVFVLMQAFEEAEDSFGVLLLEPNAVVAHRHHPVIPVVFGGYVNLGRHIRLAVL